MIGADAENPLGTQCTIRKNVKKVKNEFPKNDVYSDSI